MATREEIAAACARLIGDAQPVASQQGGVFQPGRRAAQAESLIALEYYNRRAREERLDGSGPWLFASARRMLDMLLTCSFAAKPTVDHGKLLEQSERLACCVRASTASPIEGLVVVAMTLHALLESQTRKRDA